MCGRSFGTDEVITLNDRRVWAHCKPLFLQKYRVGVPFAEGLVYGGFWIRVVASILDGMILGVAGFLIAFSTALMPRALFFVPSFIKIILGVAYLTQFG